MPPLLILGALFLLGVTWLVFRPNHKEMRKQYNKLMGEIEKIAKEIIPQDQAHQGSEQVMLATMIAHAQEKADKKEWPEAISFAADALAPLIQLIQKANKP